MSTNADFQTDSSSMGIELFMIIIHHPWGYMVRSAPSQEHFKLLKFVKLRTERAENRARGILLRIISTPSSTVIDLEVAPTAYKLEAESKPGADSEPVEAHV